MGNDPRITANSRHLFIMRYRPEAFGGHTRAEFVSAMLAEGITPISKGYIPLHQSPAIRRALKPADLNRCQLPSAEHAGLEIVWINQTPFLGDHQDMNSIINAVKKIQSAWE